MDTDATEVGETLFEGEAGGVRVRDDDTEANGEEVGKGVRDPEGVVEAAGERETEAVAVMVREAREERERLEEGV